MSTQKPKTTDVGRMLASMLDDKPEPQPQPAPMFQIVNVGRDTINIAQIGRDELAALLASRADRNSP